MLAEKPWDKVWGDILDSNFPNGNNAFQMDIDEASATSIHNVEEGIEWWAAHSMPPLLDSQATQPEAVPTDLLVNEPGLICYGMVSVPSCCRY
jgi:hypothetical protein